MIVAVVNRRAGVVFENSPGISPGCKPAAASAIATATAFSAT